MTAVRVAPAPSLVRKIMAEECAQAQVPIADVEAGCKYNRAAWVRARIIRRLRATGKYSLNGIATALNRHHTTVIAALRRGLPEQPPQFPETLYYLRRSRRRAGLPCPPIKPGASLRYQAERRAERAMREAVA